jgi:hypothetical protein
MNVYMHLMSYMHVDLRLSQVASLLRESNVRVTLTGLYAAHQVLVAQAVGAEYAGGSVSAADAGAQSIRDTGEADVIISGGTRWMASKGWLVT